MPVRPTPLTHDDTRFALGLGAAPCRRRLQAPRRAGARATLALLVLLPVLPMWPSGSAKAESLRCEGGLAAEGDSAISVIFKCGQPALSDSYCAPVFAGPNLVPVPDALAGAYVPCLPVHEWIYPRGPGNLVATVRVRAGVVRSIVYGQPR